MIARFGSLASTIAAPAEQQRCVIRGDIPALRQLRLMRAADVQMRRRPLGERTVLTNCPALFEYLRVRQGFVQREELRAFFLDGQHHLIAEQLIAVGKPDCVPLDSRSILATALRFDANGLVLAHNHPSGSAEPSKADIAATKRLALAGAAIDLKVYDHVIVVPDGYVSFRARGLL